MKTTNWMKKHLPAIVFAIEKGSHKKVFNKKDVDSVLTTLSKMKQAFLPLTEIIKNKSTEELYAYAERAAFASRQGAIMGAKTSAKKAKTSAENGRMSAGKAKVKVS